jgi:hypothetical protein
MFPSSSSAHGDERAEQHMEAGALQKQSGTSSKAQQTETMEAGVQRHP